MNWHSRHSSSRSSGGGGGGAASPPPDVGWSWEDSRLRRGGRVGGWVCICMRLFVREGALQTPNFHPAKSSALACGIIVYEVCSYPTATLTC